MHTGCSPVFSQCGADLPFCHAGGDGSANGNGAVAPDGKRFTKRTDSAIQRSYDAAVGPPSKADAQQVQT